MEKEEKRADQENDTEEQSTEAKSLLKKKLQYYSSEIQRDVGNLVKWLMIAVSFQVRNSSGKCPFRADRSRESFSVYGNQSI